MSESQNVNEIASQYFSKWTSNKLLSTFRSHKRNLSALSKQFLIICFNGIKVGERSIYLTNAKMKQTLEGYDDWSPYILTGDVGLHMKFKTNAGILAHILKKIQLYEEDEQKKKELNQWIFDKTNKRYSDFDQMLGSGMYVYIFFSSFCRYNTQEKNKKYQNKFAQQVKTQNI